MGPVAGNYLPSPGEPLNRKTLRRFWRGFFADYFNVRPYSTGVRGALDELANFWSTGPEGAFSPGSPDSVPTSDDGITFYDSIPGNKTTTTLFRLTDANDDSVTFSRLRYTVNEMDRRARKEELLFVAGNVYQGPPPATIEPYLYQGPPQAAHPLADYDALERAATRARRLSNQPRTEPRNYMRLVISLIVNLVMVATGIGLHREFGATSISHRDQVFVRLVETGDVPQAVEIASKLSGEQAVLLDSLLDAGLDPAVAYDTLLAYETAVDGPQKPEVSDELIQAIAAALEAQKAEN